MSIKNAQETLRKLNGNMSKKVFEMVQDRETVMWDYGRMNEILVYDDSVLDLAIAKRVIPAAFAEFDYKVSVKYVSNSTELSDHNHVRYYMSFLNYSNEYSKNLEVALCDLKSQHFIVVTAYHYEEVKDVVEKYGCYFLPKPYTKSNIIDVIEKIQENLPEDLKIRKEQ